MLRCWDVEGEHKIDKTGQIDEWILKQTRGGSASSPQTGGKRLKIETDPLSRTWHRLCELSWSIEHLALHAKKARNTPISSHLFSCLTTLPLLFVYAEFLYPRVVSGQWHCQPQTMWCFLPLLNSYSSITPLWSSSKCNQEVLEHDITWSSQYLLYFLPATFPKKNRSCKPSGIFQPFGVNSCYNSIPPDPRIASAPAASDRFQRNMLAKLWRGDFRKTLLRATEDLAFAWTGKKPVKNRLRYPRAEGAKGGIAKGTKRHIKLIYFDWGEIALIYSSLNIIKVILRWFTGNNINWLISIHFE